MVDGNGDATINHQPSTINLWSPGYRNARLRGRNTVTVRLSRSRQATTAAGMGTIFLSAIWGMFAVAPSARAEDPASKLDSFTARTLASGRTEGWVSVVVRLDSGISSAAESQINSIGGDI